MDQQPNQFEQPEQMQYQAPMDSAGSPQAK